MWRSVARASAVRNTHARSRRCRQARTHMCTHRAGAHAHSPSLPPSTPPPFSLSLLSLFSLSSLSLLSLSLSPSISLSSFSLSPLPNTHTHTQPITYARSGTTTVYETNRAIRGPYGAVRSRRVCPQAAGREQRRRRRDCRGQLRRRAPGTSSGRAPASGRCSSRKKSGGAGTAVAALTQRRT